MIPQPQATVAALVLYGSRARGDSDDRSDTDVAVFTYAQSMSDLQDLKRWVTKSSMAPPDATFAIYSTATADRMAERGSLFLWHVRLEGRVLYDHDKWLAGLWQRHTRFSRSHALDSIQIVEMVVDDVTNALRQSPATAAFEGATLFSMLRTLGMVLGQAIGKLAFGRRSAVDLLRSTLRDEFTLTSTQVRQLEVARLEYAGKIDSSGSAESPDYLAPALQIKKMLGPIRHCLDLEAAQW